MALLHKDEPGGGEMPSDGRQDSGFEPLPSRFRPRYRQLTDDERALADEIKAKAAEMDALYERVGWRNPRYHDLAIGTLEQSVMWIIKELTD